MRLYLIRHADPDYERDSLTEQGRQEAERLAERLQAIGINYLYTSPAGRTKATAKYAADRLDISYQVAPWLQEPSHLKLEQQGQPYVIWDTFGETVRADPVLPGSTDWQQRPPFDRPDLAQVWRDFQARADRLTADHGYSRVGGRYRPDRPNQDRIALVGHNGTVLLFLAHLLALPLPLVWCGFYAWPASLTTIHFESWSAEWAVPRALGVADVSHLYAAGLPPQPRAMGEWYEAYR